MNIIDAAQGSAEWHAHRSNHFNASDAPAMMGLSPYKTRSELLRELATGITSEIDPATQRRFDDGHRFEALARPIAEKIIGEDLYPVVGYDGMLSASFDGLTMDGTICFEHKTINSVYREAVATGSTLPLLLLVQIEQQLMLAGATRCLFMASRWNDDDTLAEEVHCFVESDPELRQTLLQGWTQFAIDLESYVHVEQTVAPVAATIEALPALFVQVEGKVLATNLDAFKEAAHTFIANIKTELSTDQDFADADKMVKFLKDGEDRLALCKDQAQSQAKSIDELFRTIDSISEQMRVKRLVLDKLVKSEKDNRRTAILIEADNALAAHFNKLNERIGGNWMPANLVSAARFAEAIKGLKSLDSMRDKVSTALANAKIEANEIADRIQDNRFEMEGELDWSFLFPDFSAVCTKARDDFDALLMARIAKHNEAQAAKDKAAKDAEEARIAAAVEAERKAGEARAAAEAERIRQEEAAKLTANNQTQFEDQRGKTAEATHAVQQATEPPQAPAASTPPIASAVCEQHTPDAIIDDFIRLLSISAVEKKALRPHLLAWEKYRIAREMQDAA